MRKQRIALMAVLVAGTALGSLWAMSEPVVEAKIPFDFVIADRTLPAGQYTLIRLEDESTAWVIRSQDLKTSVDFLTNEAEMKEPAAKSDLEFNVLNGKHYLSKIWIKGREIGREVVPSHAEQALMRHGMKAKKEMVDCRG